MSNAEYNEAQFEIEKAEAVKEARNAALEEAAKMFDSDAETATRLLAFNPDFCLVVKSIATQSAVRVRALKTLAILLPLLFVFGVAAGEERAEPRRAAEIARVEHGRLWKIWSKRNALGLSETEKAALFIQIQTARNAARGESKPVIPYRSK